MKKNCVCPICSRRLHAMERVKAQSSLRNSGLKSRIDSFLTLLSGADENKWICVHCRKVFTL